MRSGDTMPHLHLKLEEAKLVGCLWRTDDESSNMTNIAVAACHCDGEIVVLLRAGNLACDSGNRAVGVGGIRHGR